MVQEGTVLCDKEGAGFRGNEAVAEVLVSLLCLWKLGSEFDDSGKGEWGYTSSRMLTVWLVSTILFSVSLRRAGLGCC